jgi:GT2 family glycosyltransferase
MTANNLFRGESKISPISVYSIILNFNNFSDTIITLESVFSQDYRSNSVILVENSTDKTIIQKIRTRFPGIDILENETNLGYAGGNNRGIREAISRGADYIFLLNNDVILEKDVIRKCVEGMEEVQDCAACQPLIAYYENRNMIWSAGTKLSFGYPRLFLKGRKLYRDRIQKSPYGLVGCAILFRTSAIEQIGLFDESLFLFQEESDWCIRARQKKYSLLIISSAVVYHKISATIGLFSRVYLYYIGRNWLLVGRKNFHWVYYVYILITELFIRFPYYFFQLARKGQIPLLIYYLRGIKDGIFGLAGEIKI